MGKIFTTAVSAILFSVLCAAPPVFASISIQGTGFDRDVLPGSVAIALFAFWVTRGAPVSKRAEGGFNLVWVLIIAGLLWMLFAPPTSHGAAVPVDPPVDEAEIIRIEDGPISDEVFGGMESRPGIPKPGWSGRDITVPAIVVILILTVSGGSDGGKKRAILPFLPFLLALSSPGLSSPGLVHAADVGMEAASGEWWRFPWNAALCFASLFCAKICAIRDGRPMLAAAFVAIAIVAGIAAVRYIPEAHGFAGNFFESDGTRAIREAEADRIRTENELARLRAALDAERQRALLRIAIPPESEGRRDAAGPGTAVFLLLFAVSVAGVGLAFHFMRAADRAQEEIRRIAFRLEIAERAGSERFSALESRGGVGEARRMIGGAS